MKFEFEISICSAQKKVTMGWNIGEVAGGAKLFFWYRSPDRIIFMERKDGRCVRFVLTCTRPRTTGTTQVGFGTSTPSESSSPLAQDIYSDMVIPLFLKNCWCELDLIWHKILNGRQQFVSINREMELKVVLILDYFNISTFQFWWRQLFYLHFLTLYHSDSKMWKCHCRNIVSILNMCLVLTFKWNHMTLPPTFHSGIILPKYISASAQYGRLLTDMAYEAKLRNHEYGSTKLLVGAGTKAGRLEPGR